jgi:putative ABC transport system permease protein
MMLLHEIRYACRLLLKDPWFTLVAALALGLGIGLNTTVFTFVNAVLIRGLPFDHSEELLYLNSRSIATGDDRSVSYLDFQDWRAQTHAFQGLAALEPNTMNISEAGRPAERFSGASVSANTFKVLRQQPILGRDFAPGDDRPEAPPVVILGYTVWKNRYASDPGVIGRTIKVNDVACAVIGIMPEGMRFPVNADLWRPFIGRDDQLTKRDVRTIGLFGRLAPGATRSTVQAELSGIAAGLRQQYPDTNKDIDAAVMTFNERFNGGPIRIVFLALMGAVGFVLLIACANVANLLLARSSKRAREVAVRVALGAGRARIVRQLLVESTLLACLGGLLGLSLSYVGVRLFDAAVADVGKPYWIKFTIDFSVFGFMALVCLATGILFGLAPALQVSRTNVNEILKEGGRGSAGGAKARRLTSVMVVTELTLTLVLLTGAGLMVRSFLKLYSMELGVETSHVLKTRTTLTAGRYPTPEKRQQFYDALVARLGSLPGVSAAATATRLPLEGGDGRQIEFEGRPAPDPKSAPRAAFVFVSPGYFDALALPVRRGRLFRDQDGTPGSETVVVSEQFAARFFPNEEVLGKRFRNRTAPERKDANPWLTIVGIVPTVRQANPQNADPDPVAYQAFRQRSPAGTAILVRAAGSPTAITAMVRQAVQQVDQDQPMFDVRTLDEDLAMQQWPYRVFGSMFAIFAIIALVLSAVGIYAVTSYAVTQRTSEIGVRMALGAQPKQVSWLILKSGCWQLAIGLSLGLLGGWGVTFVMESLLVQISRTDPLTFAGITAILSIVTLAACIVPARRATRLDPLQALNRS